MCDTPLLCMRASPASPPLRLSTSPPPPSPPTTPNTQKHPLPHPILGPECLSRPQKMVLTTETGPLGTGTSQLGMAHRPLPMTYHAPPPLPIRPDALMQGTLLLLLKLLMLLLLLPSLLYDDDPQRLKKPARGRSAY